MKIHIKPFKKGGSIIILVFLVIVALLIIGVAFTFRSVSEKHSVDIERSSIQAFYLAEAGANDSINTMDGLINHNLKSEVSQANPNQFASWVTSWVNNGTGIQLLTGTGQWSGVPAFIPIPGEPTQAKYTFPSTGLGEGNYGYEVIVSYENGIKVNEVSWFLNYTFVVESIGAISSVQREVVIEGDFGVNVMQDYFARYALFTDHQGAPSGGPSWFNATTSFTGPIHSNDRFSFQGVPAGIFSDEITQHLLQTQFYNNGKPILINANYNQDPETLEIIDDPQEQTGYFLRGVAEINMPGQVQKNQLKEITTAGEPVPPNVAIYVPNDAGLCIGGIYVDADANIVMDSIEGGNKAQYQISVPSESEYKQIEIDYPEDPGQSGTTTIKTYQDPGFQTLVGEPTVYTGIPDGPEPSNAGIIIYVEGNIDQLEGTVQRQSAVTVSAAEGITITNNILYEEYNPGPPPNAFNTDNLLGILAWGEGGGDAGNILVSSSCPANLTIHGILMAHNGIFEAANYGVNLGPDASITLLGGVIDHFFMDLGTVAYVGGEWVLQTGYASNFVYDGRTQWGTQPPYFPTINAYIAFTKDLRDRLKWYEGNT